MNYNFVQSCLWLFSYFKCKKNSTLPAEKRTIIVAFKTSSRTTIALLKFVLGKKRCADLFEFRLPVEILFIGRQCGFSQHLFRGRIWRAHKRSQDNLWWAQKGHFSAGSVKLFPFSTRKQLQTLVININSIQLAHIYPIITLSRQIMTLISRVNIPLK